MQSIASYTPAAQAAFARMVLRATEHPMFSGRDIIVTTNEADTDHCADLMARFDMDRAGGRFPFFLPIGVRWRKRDKPFSDVTVRLSNGSDDIGEAEKLIAGKGGWMFYARCDGSQATEAITYAVTDRFRRLLKLRIKNGLIFKNSDGSSFVGIDVDDLDFAERWTAESGVWNSISGR